MKMKKYLTLTKILFKCGLNSQMEGSRKKGLAKMQGPLLYLLIGICFLPMMVIVFFGIRTLTPMLVSYHAQDGILLLAVYLGAAVTFVFGFSMVISVFYTTSDLPVLLAMPLSPECITAAKGTLSLLYEYLMILLYVGPMLAGYGAAMHGGPIYWICFTVICLLLPVTPLAWCGILSMLFMRIFRRIRSKQALTAVSMSLAIVMGVGVGIFGQSMSGLSVDAVRSMTSRIGGLRYFFPQLIPAVLALQEMNLLYLLLYVIATAATAALFIFLSRFLYFKGAIGMTEAAQKQKKLKSGEAAKYMKSGNRVISYALVEMKKVMRSPTYFMNGVMIDFIWPVFFLIPFIGQIAGKHGSDSGEMMTVFGFLTDKAGQLNSQYILLAVLYGIVFFTTTFNFMTPSTISREGKNLWFMKSVPMGIREQLSAKILGSLPVTVLTSVGYGLVLCIIAIVNGMTPLIIFYLILLSVPSIALINYVQLLFDLRWAKLIWQNEAVPIKQNFHAIAATGVCMMIAGLPLGAAVPMALLKLPPILIAAAVFAILSILAVAFRIWLMEYGEERMAELP